MSTQRHQEQEGSDPAQAGYRDPDTLERLYWEEELTTYDIADRFDVSNSTVRKWMVRYGIDRREGGSKKAQYMRMDIDTYGHVVWRQSANINQREVHFGIHRLLAISEYGTEAVAGMDVHHKNGIPWDNRPANIEPLTHSDHTKLHAKQRGESETRTDGGTDTPATGDTASGADSNETGPTQEDENGKEHYRIQGRVQEAHRATLHMPDGTDIELDLEEKHQDGTAEYNVWGIEDTSEHEGTETHHRTRLRLFCDARIIGASDDDGGLTTTVTLDVDATEAEEQISDLREQAESLKRELETLGTNQTGNCTGVTGP